MTKLIRTLVDRPFLLVIPVLALILLGGVFWHLGGKSRALGHVATGKKHMEAKEWLPAIHAFDEAIDEDSTLAEAYLLRATAINDYVKAGKPDADSAKQYERGDALRDCEQALQLNPNWGEAYMQKGAVFEGMGESKSEDARIAYSEAIRHLKDPTEAYVARASLAPSHKNYQEAVSDLTSAIDKYPSRAEYYERRAVYSRHLGEPDNARRDLAKAVSLRKQPDAPDYEDISIAQDKPEVVAEVKRLHGRWKVTAAEAQGAAKDISDFAFSRNQFAQVIKSKIQQQGRIRLDPGKVPGQIDLVRTGPLQKEATSLGIYELKDKTLRLCISAPGEARPTDFTTQGQKRNLYSLAFVPEEKP